MRKWFIVLRIWGQLSALIRYLSLFDPKPPNAHQELVSSIP